MDLYCAMIAWIIDLYICLRYKNLMYNLGMGVV